LPSDGGNPHGWPANTCRIRVSPGLRATGLPGEIMLSLISVQNYWAAESDSAGSGRVNGLRRLCFPVGGAYVSTRWVGLLARSLSGLLLQALMFWPNFCNGLCNACIARSTATSKPLLLVPARQQRRVVRVDSAPLPCFSFSRASRVFFPVPGCCLISFLSR